MKCSRQLDMTALTYLLVSWKLIKWLRNVASLSRKLKLIICHYNEEFGKFMCLLGKLKWPNQKWIVKSQLISFSHLSIGYIYISLWQLTSVWNFLCKHPVVLGLSPPLPLEKITGHSSDKGKGSIMQSEILAPDKFLLGNSAHGIYSFIHYSFYSATLSWKFLFPWEESPAIAFEQIQSSVWVWITLM